MRHAKHIVNLKTTSELLFFTLILSKHMNNAGRAAGGRMSVVCMRKCCVEQGLDRERVHGIDMWHQH